MDNDGRSEEIFSKLIPNLNDELNEDTIFPISDEILELKSRYRAGPKIGSGSMKDIFTCSDKLTSRQVAQARLHDSNDPEIVELFFKEARLTAHLEHPNIMPLYDIGYDVNGEPYFTMKVIDGHNLTDFIQNIKEFGEVNFREMMDIFLKVCDAVAYAHSKEIVHLDLNPNNIRLGQFGEVLVCDWGLAKYIGEDEETLTDYLEFNNEATLYGVIKGTPGYMAPEQVDIELSARDRQTDIYALGGVMYSLLCFEAPITGDLKDVLKQTLNNEISPPSKLNTKTPKSLEAVAMKALSQNSQDRYENVGALQQDIRNWLDGYSTSAENRSSWRDLALLVKRHRTLFIFASLLFVASGIFSVAIVIKERQAVSALKRFEQERLAKEAAGREAAPRLTHLALLAFKNYDYESAEDILQQAFERDPNSQEAWQLKARFSFFEQNFTQTAEALVKVKPPYEHNAIKNLVSYFPNLPKRLLTAEELKSLYKMYGAKYDILFLYNRSFKRYSRPHQLVLCKTFLKLQNKKMKSLKFDFVEEGKKLSLDLSKNTKLESVEALAPLMVTHLDISETHINSLAEISHLPLIELNLSHTSLRDFSELEEYLGLKKLIISAGQETRLPLLSEKVEIIIVE